MATYILRRLAQIAPLVVLVLIVNFVLIQLAPGDAVSALAGENASLEYQEQLRKEYGLDQPLHVQFAAYVGKLLAGDLGYSFGYRQPVADLVLSRIPATLLLVFAAEIPAIVLGTVLAAISVRRLGTWVDKVIGWVSLGLYSVPVFWSGMVAILLFAVTFRILPTSGMTSYGEGGGSPLDIARHLILPATVLGLFQLPVYVRLMRTAMLDVVREDYVTTARAIGFTERTIFSRHVLRNALLPTITVIGLSFGMVFAGALLTETVFGWPGMGQLMYQAVFQRDYPLMMGIFLLTAICVAIATLIADLCYALADPRVRLKGAK